MIILENDTLKVEISNLGAEVRSIYNKELKKEYMWQANPEWWGRTSPILFPIVGTLYDNQYIYEDTTYTMKSHGFLRDSECNVIQEGTDSVTLVLESNDDTYENYPFIFKVEIKYILKEMTLESIWTIYNQDSKPMYYSIGAHPAFNIDKTHEYRFNIQGEDMKQYGLNGAYIEGIIGDAPTSLPLSKDLFIKNTTVLSNVDYIQMQDLSNDSSIDIECKGFKFCAIWSPMKDGEMAPFVCIEPWMGINDVVSGQANIKEKLGINKLSVNNQEVYSYKVMFNER